MADEILQEFLAESWENLSRLDLAIVSLECEPANAGLLAGIFRTIHTIKGTCGYLGLGGLEGVAHATENVLGKMRAGRLETNASTISLVLEGVDRIKEHLQGLEATGEEPRLDSARLIHRLNLLASLGDQPVHGTQDVPALSIVPRNEVESLPPVDSKPACADLSIRVNVEVLDQLMNLVGELVLARNQMLQMVRGEDEARYAGPMTQLNRVTTELHEQVLKARMQPIGHAWSKLPRVVRDLARVTGKPMELELAGAETELDRTVLDAIRDPLIHMLRNAADHGIEHPAQRRAVGKPDAGRLRLTARQEAGQAVICLEDDGAGVNRDKVIQTALKQELIQESAAAQLSDDDLIRLIFQPGFSTADQVTSISGRGVGMDVVRTEVERIGGTVEMTSTPGQGTVIRIKIPLSMAIISALVVESGGQTFAIPQLAIVELVRLTAKDRCSSGRNEKQDTFRLRDRVLPLIHLHEVLQLPASQKCDDADINIAVVQLGEEQFGLRVDSVCDAQELVVKPVGELLKQVPVYQGTAILGDGRVVLILEIAGIAAQFGRRSTTSPERVRAPELDELSTHPISLLRFRTLAGDTMAVPLALVSRLEEIPRDELERIGHRLALPYRGRLVPLLSLAGDDVSVAMSDRQPVIVFTDNQQTLGLMVDQIQDIVEEPLILQLPSPRPGVLGTAVVSGAATEILDIQHYVSQADRDWYRHLAAPPPPKKMLVIDDSMFFRQLVRTALEASGYRATAVEGAERAIELINQGEAFDAILCDIEMPGIDGCQFAAWCRQQPATRLLPLVAITSLDGEVHGPRIMNAGFDRLLIKFQPQQLRDTLAELLRQPGRVATGLSA